MSCSIKLVVVNLNLPTHSKLKALMLIVGQIEFTLDVINIWGWGLIHLLRDIILLTITKSSGSVA